MNITKAQSGGDPVEVTSEELAQINGFSRKELTEEEVYVFSVKLCDNEVDRDGECFPRETLSQLQPLFLGKSGIFDHSWSAGGQWARLFATEVVDEMGVVTRGGEGYSYLKGLAYMVRTNENSGLITEIEGGIKKEVSVGCSVRRSECSICGGDPQSCPHQKGEEYGGNLCYTKLMEAQDAYEFSFVAVPAQPSAGVMRRKGYRNLKAICKEFPEVAPELSMLEGEAKLGRKYLNQLRDEVVRLGLLSQKGMAGGTLRSIVDKLSEGELVEMKATYEQQAGERFPIGVQLCYGGEQSCGMQDNSFLI